MVLARCGEECGIVGCCKMLHQCRNKLVRGQTAKLSVFWSKNNIEAPERHGNCSPMPQTAKGCTGSDNAGTKCFHSFKTSETVNSLSKQAINVVRNKHER